MYPDKTIINFKQNPRLKEKKKKPSGIQGKNSHLEREENPVDKTYEQPHRKQEISGPAFKRNSTKQSENQFYIHLSYCYLPRKINLMITDILTTVYGAAQEWSNIFRNTVRQSWNQGFYIQLSYS